MNPVIGLHNIKHLLATTFRVWRLDHASRMSAALAFYLTTSVVPMMILSLAVLGRVMEEGVAQGHLSTSLDVALGESTAGIVRGLIAGAVRPGAGTAATVFGILVLIVMASNMFHHMRGSLDAIWGIRGRQGPLKTFLVGRWVSLVLIMGVQILLLMIFSLGAVSSAVVPYLRSHFPSQAAGFLILLGYNALVFLGVFILVLVIYWLLASIQLEWRVMFMGAGVTALLFVVGKIILGLILTAGNVVSLYGAFGSLLILLLWFFYIAQIFYLGAEFTKVYAEYVQNS